MKKFFKKIGKILLYIFFIILIALLWIATIIWFKSPAKPDPVTGPNGEILSMSISTIEKVKLGGVDQYMIIRGADSTKPVMLFLHGGPGSPEFTLIKEANRAIENDFVMVYWEQRGAGKSFSRQIPANTMNMAQFISDTRELSVLLAKRFNKEKIYLMGHSWGSLLGIMTVNKFPDLFYAYFGIGQVCDQYRGERISFEWVKEQAKNEKNEKIIKKLSEMKFPDSLAGSDVWAKYLMYERNYVSKFGGGVTHQMTSMWPIVKTVMLAKEYTFSDKMKYMSGSLFSLKNLWPDVVNSNLFQNIDSLKIPIYIFQGKFDYQTPYVVAKEFFDQLKAPQKEFFTFENSAHSPIIEEVEKFNSIVLEKATLR